MEMKAVWARLEGVGIGVVKRSVDSGAVLDAYTILASLTCKHNT
jgi:hypothetical protein